MHISDGILRSRLDGELAAADSRSVEEHLSGCVRCRDRADAMAARAKGVRTLFATLAAEPAQPPLDTAAAFTCLRTGRGQSAPKDAPFWPRVAGLHRAPVWAAAAAAVLIAVLLASSPGRAVAQRLLGTLRLRTVAPVPVKRDLIAEGKGPLFIAFLANSMTVLKDEQAITVASREEAARVAGFPVRLPAIRRDAPHLRVEGEHAFHLTVNRPLVESLLKLADRPDLKLPEGLDGARVTVDIHRTVLASFGPCPESPGPVPDPSRLTSCLRLAQAPTATVITAPELNLGQLAEIGLQVSGMTAEEARSFSSAIDWTTTLAVPVRLDSTRYEAVVIDGQRGVLMLGRPRWNWPAHWSLIWVKDGRVYWLAGFGDPGAAVATAESLR